MKATYRLTEALIKSEQRMGAGSNPEHVLRTSQPVLTAQLKQSVASAAPELRKLMLCLS